MKFIKAIIFIISFLSFVFDVDSQTAQNEMIDRYALVNRHNIKITEPDVESVLSVGNGEIAYNVDITGFETFPDYYTKYPLITMAQWGWHSFPNVNNYTLADVSEEMEIRGKKHMYPSIGYSLENPAAGLDNPAYVYLRQNPHKINLGCIGFDYQMVDDEIMKNTLYCTKSSFNFDAIWGWDPPMMAMTATRIGELERAVDLLFSTSRNNNFNKIGHCQQWNHIPAYLPANGGVLLSTALMTAGWDGNNKKNPGFPDNGLWKVKYENILPLP